MEIKEQKITAKKVIVASFVVDLLDILLSVTVAVLTGSVIMLTESLEGVSDLVSSGLLWVGLKRSSKKADKSHPFGYGREIYFWTLLAALIMFGVTSTASIYFGWHRVVEPQKVHNVYLALTVLFIAFVSNGYAFYLSYKRLLKRRNIRQIVRIFYRSSLVETKTTFILDLMGTVASLLGILALAIYELTGNTRFDGIGAMAIGIVLAFFALLLLMGIRDLLVGRSASISVERKIREAALSISEVNEVLDLKTLHIGSERLLVNLEVHMKNSLDTDEIEVLMDKIKDKIQKEVPSAKYIQVELETPDRK